MAKEVKKVKEDQLKELQDVVGKLNQVQMQLGTVELQKHELLHGAVEMQKDLQDTRKKLEEEYGNVSINISDGVITEKEEENAPDKKD